DKLQAELTMLRKRTDRSTTMTLLVGAIVLIALCIYFWVGYTKINGVIEPETLVNVAQGMLDNHLPEGIKQVEEQVTQQAPVWAASLSQQTIDGIPTARAKLEEHIYEEANKKLHEVNVMSDEHFKRFLRDNKTVIEAKFKELSTSPKLAEQSLKEL